MNSGFTVGELIKKVSRFAVSKLRKNCRCPSLFFKALEEDLAEVLAKVIGSSWKCLQKVTEISGLAE